MQCCAECGNAYVAESLHTFTDDLDVPKFFDGYGKAWECGIRLCPTCQMSLRRTTRKKARKALQRLTELGYAVGRDFRLITLTMPTQEGVSLVDNIHVYHRALHFFFKRRWTEQNILGGVRGDEFTVNNLGFHVHGHLLAVTPSFINYQTLRSHWTDALREAWRGYDGREIEIKTSDGLAVVNVQFVVDRNPNHKPHLAGIEGALAEVCKYLTKSNSWQKVSGEDLIEVAAMTVWPRMFEVFGLARTPKARAWRPYHQATVMLNLSLMALCGPAVGARTVSAKRLAQMANRNQETRQKAASTEGSNRRVQAIRAEKVRAVEEHARQVWFAFQMLNLVRRWPRGAERRSLILDTRALSSAVDSPSESGSTGSDSNGLNPREFFPAYIECGAVGDGPKYDRYSFHEEINRRLVAIPEWFKREAVEMPRAMDDSFWKYLVKPAQVKGAGVSEAWDRAKVLREAPQDWRRELGSIVGWAGTSKAELAFDAMAARLSDRRFVAEWIGEKEKSQLVIRLSDAERESLMGRRADRQGCVVVAVERRRRILNDRERDLDKPREEWTAKLRARVRREQQFKRYMLTHKFPWARFETLDGEEWRGVYRARGLAVGEFPSTALKAA